MGSIVLLIIIVESSVVALADLLVCRVRTRIGKPKAKVHPNFFIIAAWVVAWWLASNTHTYSAAQGALPMLARLSGWAVYQSLIYGICITGIYGTLWWRSEKHQVG